MKKVMFWGGFHNSPDVVFNITDNLAVRLACAKDYEVYDVVEKGLSPYLLNRLDHHFCGIRGCSCGSWRRNLRFEIL